MSFACSIVNFVCNAIQLFRFTCLAIDSWQLTIIDPGHVIFANVLLNAAGLNIFKCGKPLSLHVNVAELAKIVNSCGDDTTILIEVDDQATVIKFTFDSNTSVLTFNLKCLYVHADTLRPPNSTYQCILQMKSIVFEQDIRMLHAIGRHVEVNFDNGKLFHPCVFI